MIVLWDAFNYTAKKVSQFRADAAKYKVMGEYFTDEAIKVYRSNMAMALNCSVRQDSSTQFTVMEFGLKFIVDISEMSCSCLRFYDEGIACQHILKVIDYTRKDILLTSLIDSLYLQSKFNRSFP